MEHYKNLSGTSGVSAYSIGATFIKVKFATAPKVYIYSYVKPGQSHVEHMKQLAIVGRGLSTYISQCIKKNYERFE